MSGEGLCGLCACNGGLFFVLLLLLIRWLEWAAGGVAWFMWAGVGLGVGAPAPTAPCTPLWALTIVMEVTGPWAPTLDTWHIVLLLLWFARAVVGWDFKERFVAWVCGGGRTTREIIGVGATTPAGSEFPKTWKYKKFSVVNIYLQHTFTVAGQDRDLQFPTSSMPLVLTELRV